MASYQLQYFLLNFQMFRACLYQTMLYIKMYESEMTL